MKTFLAALVSKKILTTTVVLISLCMGTFMMTKADTCGYVSVQSSSSTNDFSESCSFNKRVSWLTWLLNKSKSSQFHFLDLLELLSTEQ